MLGISLDGGSGLLDLTRAKWNLAPRHLFNSCVSDFLLRFLPPSLLARPTLILLQEFRESWGCSPLDIGMPDCSQLLVSPLYQSCGFVPCVVLHPTFGVNVTSWRLFMGHSSQESQQDVDWSVSRANEGVKEGREDISAL